MQEEHRSQCIGINGYPDKKDYMPMINESLFINHKGTWDKCYEKIESEIKHSDPGKDLSSIKKTLQERGYVRVNNNLFGIAKMV